MADRAQAILQQAIQQGLTLCLDSNCLLYYFGGQQPWQQNLHPIFEAKDQGRVQLVTSSVTLAEVLARANTPNEENQLLNAIRRYFEIVPVLDRTGIDAARIRQSTRLSVKTPDALEMATATQTSATLFITNDEQLIRAPLPGSQALYLKDLALDWLEDEFDLCLDNSQPVVSLPIGPTALNLNLLIDPTHPLSPLQAPLPATEFPLLALKLAQMTAGPAAVVGLVEKGQTEQLLAVGLLPTGRPWVMPGFPDWVTKNVTRLKHDWHEYEPDAFAHELLERVQRLNQSAQGRGVTERYTLHLLADVSKLDAETAVNKMDNNGQMIQYRKRMELWKRYLAPFRPLPRLWGVEYARLWRGEAGNAHPLNISVFQNLFEHTEAIFGR